MSINMWYQQQDNEQRRRWEEMLRKMEGEVVQGRKLIGRNSLQQIIETEKVTKHEIRSTQSPF